MLMAARSSGGSPQWTRRPLPSARARHVSRSVGPLAAIADFMAPARASDARKATESDRVGDSGSDADEEEAGGPAEEVEEDEWEDLGRGEEVHEEEEEEEEEPVAFRDARFHDEDDGSCSEYAPSEAEDDSNMANETESMTELDEEDDSVAGLFAKYLPRRRRSSNKLGIARSLVLPPRRNGKSSSDSDESSFNEQDARFWSSAQEKQQWVSRYRAADREFQRSFGCPIDSQALPEAKQRLRRERTHRPAYVVVVLALIAMYTVQLAGISPAALSPVPLISTAAMGGQKAIAGIFSGNVEDVVVTNDAASEVLFTLERSAAQDASPSVEGVEPSVDSGDRTVEDVMSDVTSSEQAAMDRMSTGTSTGEASNSSLVSTSEEAPSDYTKAAIDLCGHLLYRVVTSHHDQKVAQNAASACDIAVKLASYGSLDGAVAHAQRGDLRSVLAEFEAADADYAVAALGLLSVASSGDGVDEDVISMLQSAVHAKAVSNRWVQLYMARDADEFVQEILHAAPSSEDATTSFVGSLAADWLSVFKREKTVVEALTALRVWTLRRLNDFAPPSTR